MAKVVVVSIVILLAGLGNAGCRSWRIDQCRDRGGQPVIPAWLSDDPADVRCIE